METVLGLKGKDFVMLASDTMLAKSIFFLKDSKYTLPGCRVLSS